MLPETTHKDGVSISPDIVRLPFSFAKRHGVVIEKNNDGCCLYFTGRLSAVVLGEVRRVIGVSFSTMEMDKSAFEQKLTTVYQRDSSEARQLMEDIGSDSDDFFSLAEEMPEPEDLLESEGDAPIKIGRAHV